MKAECFEKFTKLQRGDDFIKEMDEMHNLMQVVHRFEAHVDHCINKGKVTEYNALKSSD